MNKRYLFLILLLVSGIDYAMAQAGALDPSFGNGGIVMYDSGGNHDNAADLHVYDDLSILTVGTQMDLSYNVTGILQKFLPDGTIDLTWGTNGIVEMNYGVDTHPTHLTVADDGTILVTGSVYVTVSDAEMFAARMHSDGTPDLGFNGTGLWIGAYADSEELGYGVTIQPDGKIILVGQAGSTVFSQMLFARLNTNGTLDTGFGTNGYTMIDINSQNESVRDVGLLSTGEIIGMGYVHVSDPLYTECAMIAKLNSNGIPVAGFGNNGVVIPSIFPNTSYAYAGMIVNDDIILTGTMNSNSFFLAKVDANGQPVSSFGNGGLTTLQLNPTNIGLDVILGGDNKYYVCGTTGDVGIGAPRDFLIVRYDINGVIDPSFDGDGYVITNVRPAWDDANAINLAADGKIVVAGFTSGYSTGDYNNRVVARYLNDYIPPQFAADFEADQNIICEGDQVQFTDLSEGVITGWSWTFEGGTPATSTLQNPLVTYNTEGTYDVKLVITDGIQSDSLTLVDFIQVVLLPVQPSTPVGPDALCQGEEALYTTTEVLYAQSYQWQVTPTDAGTISGTGLEATFTTADDWTGDYAISVRAIGGCGSGPWSAELSGTLNMTPAAFTLEGEGAWCSGGQGAELILNGSETGVSYQLLKDNVNVGDVVAGTGSPINFGYFTNAGVYSVTAAATICEQDMYGTIWVHEVLPPAQAGTPAGPESVCGADSVSYSVVPVADADSYNWSLNPQEAGTMVPFDNMVSINWSSTFSGTALLTTAAVNNCGEGDPSPALSIEVGLLPTPVISGPDWVCHDQSISYSTQENMGSSYEWTVTGGSVIEGSGTFQVIILWGDAGVGSVSLSETASSGCTGEALSVEVTIDACTGLIENEAQDLRCYPNPVTDRLTVERNNSGTAGRVTILSTMGTTLFDALIPAGTDKQVINTSSFGSGYYLLIYSEDGCVLARTSFIVR